MNLKVKLILGIILIIFCVIGIAFIPSVTLSNCSKAIIITIFIVFGLFFLFKLYYQESLEIKQKSKILLIGPAGVGKTKTYKYLKCKTIMNFNRFQLGEIGNICLVDTPTMDLDCGIDERVDAISQFQQFFVNFKTSISAIMMVVNFERTDLMKQKLLRTLKYLKKFQDMIYILITDFHLSEDHEGDKSQLQQSLKFLNLKGIIFLNKEENEKLMIEELNAIERKSSHQVFDINDTIFAVIDDKMNASLMDQINLKIMSMK